jgi:4,4'-diaponeurosporenoate glycosyltransferase
VREKVLENFHLAAHCREAGVPVHSAAGRGVVSFRMYPGSLRDLIEGWTKGFSSGAGRTPGGRMFLLLAWLIGLMAAWIGLAATGFSLPWLVLYAACAAQVLLFARRAGSFHWLAAVFYPLPLVFFLILFTRSARRSGKNVTWKGREIRAD